MNNKLEKMWTWMNMARMESYEPDICLEGLTKITDTSRRLEGIRAEIQSQDLPSRKFHSDAPLSVTT
jgi:hypothetical protein